MLTKPMAYDQIIDRLKQSCTKFGLGKVYGGLELSEEFNTDVEIAKTRGTEFFIDPMPPIDLVAVKTLNEPAGEEPQNIEERKSRYYTLFWYISPHESNINKLEQRLRFYQFHLSRVVPIKAIEMIIVTCPKTTLNLNDIQDMARANGFGLWRFENIVEQPMVLLDPFNFREHMQQVITHPPDERMIQLSDPVKKEAEKLSLYVDRFVRDAIEALAGQSPSRVGRRYIDRQILDLAFKVNHLCYAERLKELVTHHLLDKNDDFDFVDTAFSQLWKDNFPEIPYSEFLKNAEIPLHNIFVRRSRPYRDHYLHQFQVFMLGSAIIDKLISLKHPDIINHPDIDKQWLVVSSFHDVAYPLELYDYWAKRFFQETLGIPDLGVSDIKSYFIDNSLLSTVGFIINELCKVHFNQTLNGNWLNDEKSLLLFFHDRITKQKHHSILGSIFLLKQAQAKNSNNLYNIFIPSALAIALHHYKDVFKNACKSEKDKPDNAWDNLPKSRQIETVDFSVNPLAFVLMFCDCAQEWGRPKLCNLPITHLEDAKNFTLSDCTIDDKTCSITLSSQHWDSTEDKFQKKNEEIVNLQKMLRCPKNFEFLITLVDKSDERSEHLFKRK